MPEQSGMNKIEISDLATHVKVIGFDATAMIAKMFTEYANGNFKDAIFSANALRILSLRTAKKITNSSSCVEIFAVPVEISNGQLSCFLDIFMVQCNHEVELKQS